MAQTVQILRTTTNNPPAALLPGALSVELGTQTKLWIGAQAGNRLLLSTDPADVTLSGGAIIASAAPDAMPGSLWWDSNIGQLYIRYFDGNSTAWVSASTGTSIALPLAIEAGGTSAITAPAALTNLGAVAKAGDTMTGNLTVSGNVSAFNHTIVNQAAGDAGLFGFTNTNGPSIMCWGNTTGNAGALLFTTSGVERVRIANNGNATFSGEINTSGAMVLGVGIGNSTYLKKSDAVYIYNNADVLKFAFNNTSGAASKPGGGTWADVSDIRTKENVLDYTTGLAAVTQLKPVSYQKNGKFGTERDGRTYVGLVAQDAKEIMPEMVSISDDILEDDKRDNPAEILQLDATALIYAMLNSIKELNVKVEALTPAPGVARR